MSSHAATLNYKLHFSRSCCSYGRVINGYSKYLKITYGLRTVYSWCSDGVSVSGVAVLMVVVLVVL